MYSGKGVKNPNKNQPRDQQTFTMYLCGKTSLGKPLSKKKPRLKINYELQRAFDQTYSETGGKKTKKNQPRDPQELAEMDV